MRKIRGALKAIMNSERIAYDQFASTLNISAATADNAVRDLVNMGIVSANRIAQVFERACDDSVGATTKIIDFLQSHCIFIKTKELIDGQGGASLNEICNAAEPEYSFLAIDEKTLQQYTRRIIAYCMQFGLLKKSGGKFVSGERVNDILESFSPVTPINEIDVFRAAAPPERVVELIDFIRNGTCKKGDAEARGLRNAIFAASTLGLITQQNGELSLSEDIIGCRDTVEAVRRAVMQVEPFKNSQSDFDQTNLSADEVGTIIADLYSLNWSTGSCKRYGSGIKRWLRWIGCGA